jgi:hypothetical protein
MTENMMIFLVTQAFILSGAWIGIYIKVTSKIRELEIRMGLVEKQDTTITAKLDAIQTDVTEIKIEMQNKQNKP